MIRITVNSKERILFKIFSQLTKIFIPLDRYIYKTKKTDEIDFSPIFIIGAPRTGSTVFYQYFINWFDIAYVSNFLSYFYHSILIGSILDKRFIKKSALSFESNYGITKGLQSPSECGHLWYRWFDKNDFNSSKIYNIRKNILLMFEIYSKNVVFKNLYNGQRIKILKKIFPNALFIFVKRNPLYTAQSILKARVKYFKNRKQWFSVKPKNFQELQKLDYHDQIVKQIYFIEKQINQDLRELYQNQYIEVEYENFCKNPKNIIKSISDFFSKTNISIKEKEKVQTTKILNNNKITLSLNDINKFKAIINELDWDNYSS